MYLYTFISMLCFLSYHFISSPKRQHVENQQFSKDQLAESDTLYTLAANDKYLAFIVNKA